jgi:hypothetical protein
MQRRRHATAPHAGYLAEYAKPNAIQKTTSQDKTAVTQYLPPIFSASSPFLHPCLVEENIEDYRCSLLVLQ